MKIFVVIFCCLLTLNSFGFFDRIYEGLELDKSRYCFRCTTEPFGNLSFGFDVFYRGVVVKLGNRNLGEFEIIDENKEVLHLAYLYDIFCEIGYVSRVFGNWFLGGAVSGKYEYCFLFSDVSMGIKVGGGFSGDPVSFFNNFVIGKDIGVEGFLNYSFDRIINIGVGYVVNWTYQDFYIFLSSRVFEYQGFVARMNVGFFYGTLKEMSPFIKISFGYNYFTVGYGILVYGIEVFQDFVVELKM